MSSQIFRITNLSSQVRNPDRINIYIDGKYKFSLTTKQVIDLGVKVGFVFDEKIYKELEAHSVFGKVYARALEWSMSRPRSEKELSQYLYKKTLDKNSKRKDGQPYIVKGVPLSVTQEVASAIIQKGYVSDRNFARFWIENRMRRKGVSMRRLRSELALKGVSRDIIDEELDESERDDKFEIQKVIDKKRNSYKTEEKLIGYLARQGFSYEDIKRALSVDFESDEEVA